MDNEQAKLILQAYRPGGEDAADPFFSEALERARRDPELGRWFAEQRAFDDTMRQALQMEVPPAGLRDAISLARKVIVLPQKTHRSFWQPRIFLAQAAAILLLVGVVVFLLSHSHNEANEAMTVSDFTKQVLELKENGVTLGKKSSDPAEIRLWLSERGAPSDFELPPGLRNVPGIGCQSYMLNGIKVSLICFTLGKNQIVHLFVISKDSLKDGAPDSHPQVQSSNGSAWATWTSGGKSYLLTGMNVTENTLRQLI